MQKDYVLEKDIKSVIRTIPNFPKEGIQFKDISPIFQDPQLSKRIINAFAKEAKGKIDAICGIESRGFIFGFPIALALDIPFILIRKEGKLPPPTLAVSYDLEYGSTTIEVIKEQLKEGMRIMIHDDVLATGGTAVACAKLVTELGATVSQFTFLLELDDLQGRKKLKGSEVVSLVNY